MTFPDTTEFQFDPDADKDPTLIPPGTYRLECMNAEPRETKNGDPMWTLEFSVIEPVQFASVTTGTRIFDNLVFSKGSQRFTYKKLYALGLNVQAGQSFSAKPAEAIGRKMVARIQQEEHYQDPTRKINRIIATSARPDTGSLPPDVLSQEQKAEMAGPRPQGGPSQTPQQGAPSSSSSPAPAAGGEKPPF